MPYPFRYAVERRLVISFLLFLFLAEPSFSAGQSGSAAVPDTAAGLKAFLQQLAEVAASDDSGKTTAALQQLEIPEPGKWFYDLLGAEPSKRVTVIYLMNPRGRETELQKQLATVKTRDREILASPLVGSSGRPLAPAEQAFVGAMKTPQLFYSVKLVDLADNSVIPVGYFVHIGGAFRFIDLAALQAVDTSKPIRVRQFAGGPVAKAIHRTNPAYPEEARQEQVSGIVILEVVIGTDGTVKEASPLSGPPQLVDAARNAVQQWTFEPPTYNGVAVELVASIEMSFRMAGGPPPGSSSELSKVLPATAPPTSYPEKGGGLERELKDLLKARKAGDKATAGAILRSFVLPDPEKWFTTNFGEDVGKQMAEKYIPVTHVMVQMLQNQLDHVDEAKMSDVEVRKFDKPCDDHADDYVYPLLLARSEQTPLYEALFRNGNSYQQMNSFVFVDGAFRYIGRVNIPESLLFDEMRRKASDSPAAASNFKKSVKLETNAAAGRLIKRVPPVYPEDARREYKQGVVRLLVVVQEDGSVGEIRVAKGICSLSRALMDAVKQWRYQPFLVNGQTIRVFTTVETNFTLNR